jgi:hypothetical protein
MRSQHQQYQQLSRQVRNAHFQALLQLAESETLQKQVLNKPSRWFWCRVKFKEHGFQTIYYAKDQQVSEYKSYNHMQLLLMRQINQHVNGIPSIFLMLKERNVMINKWAFFQVKGHWCKEHKINCVSQKDVKNSYGLCFCSLQ